MSHTLGVCDGVIKLRKEYQIKETILQGYRTCYKLLFNTNEEIYFLGDTNLNILDTSSSPLRNFINMMQSFALRPAISKPTRITELSSALIENIDNIFTNVDCLNFSSAIVYSDISDHLL